MANSLSCVKYLTTLSKPEIYCWVRLNLSEEQIARVWLAVIGSPIDKKMQDSPLGYRIISLCDHYVGSKLIAELIEEKGQDYEQLPSPEEITQIALALINKAKEQGFTSLDLSCLLLNNLPSVLFELTHLEVLYLADNLIETLPNSISFLKSLKHLNLSRNNISSLPPEIGQLSSLSILFLNNNQLSSLPNSFGQLSNLFELYLSNNKLSSLPESFGQLSNLYYLPLSDNKLSSLPESFGQLSNLHYLFLNNNQLSSLPSTINKLPNLNSLTLEGNELLRIPPEILELEFEPSKILNYYFETSSKKEKRKLNEVKMLVVGEGKVGKTSLVNKLVHNIFNDPELMTEGIIIKKHWPAKLEDAREIKVNIWDFGGQEIMHSTHQFFLTKRSLYLLVLDSRQDEQQNRLDYWLKTIENFADDAPIIIVCNQTDVKTLELDRKSLKSKYPNIKEFVSTSCKNGDGINTLKKAITKELSTLKHIDDLLLDSWYKVKEELEKLQENHVDYLEYSEYKAMCEKENINTISEDTLIGFLHDLGTVLCFYKDFRVKTTQILNPAWVTEGVYKILNDRGLAEDKGILSTHRLSNILITERYPVSKHIFIIDMMRKFELCFDLEDSAKDKLLVPDLLPKEAPELGNWQGSLRFEYHYDLLPSSVISRFIVRMNAFIHNKTYWRYGVVLESEDKHNKALVKADLDAKKIFIFVNGRKNSRKDLLSLIRADFIKIYKTIPKLQVTRKIPLIENSTLTIDYDYLIELLELGEKFVIPPGLRKKIPINPLLDGIGREPGSETSIKEIFYQLLRSQQDLTFPGKLLEEGNNTLAFLNRLSVINQGAPSTLLNQLSNTFSQDAINKLTAKPPKPPAKQPKLSAQNPKTPTDPELELLQKEPREIDTMTTKKPTKPIHILHLSDIHLGTVEQGNIYYNQLQLDLTQNLKLDKLDYLIISGDIANKSTKEEYEAAFELINKLKINFQLKDKQVIIAPGNHDLNWDLSEEAYQTHIPKRKLPSTLTEAYIQIETGALLRDEDGYKKRFDNFSEFYKKVTGKFYPSNYEDQAILHKFIEDKLLVLSLNSAWQIDYHYTKRSGINLTALSNAISEITNEKSYQDWLKIAIWHHPVTGLEMMKDEFLQQLAVAKFEVCLHGHIHEAISNFYSYDKNRGLHIIGGGTFGAPTKAQVPSIPLQYNLLILEPNKTSITVKSRKKEKVEGAWSADARWGDKEEPKAYYSIELRKKAK